MRVFATPFPEDVKLVVVRALPLPEPASDGADDEVVAASARWVTACGQTVTASHAAGVHAAAALYFLSAQDQSVLLPLQVPQFLSQQPGPPGIFFARHLRFQALLLVPFAPLHGAQAVPLVIVHVSRGIIDRFHGASDNGKVDLRCPPGLSDTSGGLCPAVLTRL